MCMALGVNTSFTSLFTFWTGGLLGDYTGGVDADGNTVNTNGNDMRDDGVYIHSATKAELDYYASDSDATYIKLMITLDPLLATVSSQGDPGKISVRDTSAGAEVYNVINEDKHLAAYATLWLNEIQHYNMYTLQRKYTLFGTTSTGQKAFLCRYLCPQQPPVALNLNTRRSLIHFVSLLPFLPDSQVAAGNFDLWCTTQQVTILQIINRNAYVICV